MRPEIHDNVFGLLKQDAGMPDYYDATVDFSPNESVHLRLELQYVQEEDLLNVLEGAHQTFFELQTRKDAFRQAVVDEFLPRFNYRCRRENPISVETFLSYIKLEYILLSPRGSSSLSYSADELAEEFFGDHAINVSINPKFEVTHIDLGG